MRVLIFLAILGAPLAAQPAVHEGDRVRLLRPMYHEQWLQGVVRETVGDSAVVDFYQLCSDTTRRTVAKSDLLMRVAGSRHTVSATVAGTIGAIGLGRVLGTAASRTGGNRINAQRTVWLSVSLLVPYSAVKGSQMRSPKWIPFTAQDARSSHLHVARGDDVWSRPCLRPTYRQPTRPS